MRDKKVKKKILLVDGHGLAFRGFYALPEMNAPDGTPTNAVLGFMNMLLKAEAEWEPDSIVLFFDPSGPTARDAIFSDYKGSRRPTPEDFKVQMPLILELSSALGYNIVIRDGVEADDMIAACAVSAADAGMEAIMFTADKDLLQVLRGGITMARPTKGVTEFKMYDAASFTAEYGFEPSAMADYLALVGDAADNIPGVPGIGDKTARALLREYRSIDGIYENISSLAKGAQAKLTAGRSLAEMSMKLVLPQPVDASEIDLLSQRVIDAARAAEICGRLGLKKLSDRLGLPANMAAHTSKIKIEIRPCSEVPFSELLSSDRIFTAFSNDICMIDEQGRIARTGFSEVKQCLQRGIELVLADYRAWCSKYPDIDLFRHLVFDVECAHYFYHPDARSHRIAELADIAPQNGGSEACAQIAQLYAEFSSKEHGDDMMRVMHDIDLPMIPVLMSLQREGIAVDICALRELRTDLESEIDRLRLEICDAAGREINLNSPKQLGELLFERLHLPAVKKTKTGYSTDAAVLEELARLPEPLCIIPRRMLEYRECTKMLSGFVEPFIKHAIEQPDSRVRSTFLHDATGTGRLASRDPNVQNIPAFGIWAERFRGAMRPRDGHIFVSADYSQIELRVLAHLSGEERLISAFARGGDIHSETASWVFGVEAGEVTPEQRRSAKIVNFGLIYGMSAHGLSQRMGMSMAGASQFIEKYFSVLPRVRAYLTESVASARSLGFTRSIFGRIRPLSEASGGKGRAAEDRIAINAPIQSAASDIAKIAMIKFHDLLSSRYSGTSIVLQVHDSIVCETEAANADEIESELVRTMESIDVLSVPLKAEPKRGASLASI